MSPSFRNEIAAKDSFYSLIFDVTFHLELADGTIFGQV
jgi:hypothetical protein